MVVTESKAPLFNIFLQQVELFSQQDLFIRDLLNILQRSCQLQACSVRLLEGNVLTVGIAIGYKNQGKREHPVVIDRRLREWFKKSEPWIIPDIEHSIEIAPQLRQRWLQENFKSGVFIPLRIEQEPIIGVLAVFYPHIKATTESRIQQLLLFGQLFSYILHKTVLYEDIQELQQLLQHVVEFSTDAILLTDELGKILYVSKRVTQLFHHKTQSLVGDYIFHLNHSKEPVFEEILEQSRRRHSLRNFELTVQLANGQILYLQALMTRLQLYRIRRQVLLWLLRDVTSLRTAEQELNQKKEELENFVYSVSHDLKSPIVSVQGYASLLNDDVYPQFDETHRHYFDRIVSNIALMQKMIQDLLELSRVGKLETEFTSEYSGEIISEALDEFYYQIEKRQIQIVTAKRYPRVRCQRKHLKLVFSNLLSNAIKFLGDKPNPRIEIGWSRQPSRFIFYVRDTGIGIPYKEQGRIFNVFYRSQELKDIEGTGIGLTMVKKIVEFHNGQIWVESQPNVGSTFYFTLPRDNHITVRRG